MVLERIRPILLKALLQVTQALESSGGVSGKLRIAPQFDQQAGLSYAAKDLSVISEYRTGVLVLCNADIRIDVPFLGAIQALSNAVSNITNPVMI